MHGCVCARACACVSERVECGENCVSGKPSKKISGNYDLIEKMSSIGEGTH